MSNDQISSSTTMPPNQDLVETISHLVDRIASLETRLHQSAPMDTSQNAYITERSPDTEFHPYPEFAQALPSYTKDFFRNPLPEVERRRFLAECPRNVERDYTPPAINSITVSQGTKRFDSQLSDIQFRLSGITRPLDYFLHKVLQTGSVTPQDATELVNVVHELLMDSASHITQLRIDNMFKGAGIHGQAPRLANPTTQPLVEPKVLLDHVSLDKSMAQIGRRSNPRPSRGKVHSPSNSRSENEKSDIPANAGPAKPSFEHRSKGFHNGQSSRDKGKRPEGRQ